MRIFSLDVHALSMLAKSLNNFREFAWTRITFREVARKTYSRIHIVKGLPRQFNIDF